MARMFKPIHELNWTSQEDRDVRDILAAWKAARRARAEAEMAATARAHGERRFFQTPNGMGGYIRLMVHPASFHDWGQRLGYGCWNDAQFCREYARDNPAARVQNHSQEVRVIVPGNGGLAARGAKRFQKSYGRQSARPG